MLGKTNKAYLGLKRQFKDESYSVSYGATEIHRCTHIIPIVYAMGDTFICKI